MPLAECLSTEHVEAAIVARDGPSQDTCDVATPHEHVLHALGATVDPGNESSTSGGSGDGSEYDDQIRGLRIAVGLVLAAVLTALYLAYHFLDRAPNWLIKFVARTLYTQSDHLSSSEAGLSKLLRYKLDQQLSRVPSFKMILVGAITGALIILGGMALFAAGEESLYSAFWLAVAGAGLEWGFSDKAQGSSMSALLVRTVSLLLSICGMLVTALLLGLVSDAIGSKVDDLRKGKAPVLECDHTLIIGWSDKIYCLMKELCLGKECLGGRPIVILAEKGKEEMEDLIAAHALELHGSSITCRTGNPLLREELLKVSAQHASSIIILATDSDPEQSDASMLRIVLSLMGMHKELKISGHGGLKGHVVAEVCDRDHEDLVQRLGYTNMLHTLVPRDVSARMLVTCARHPQVLTALVEIMGFDGSEIYVDKSPPPLLVGLPFSLLQSVYPKAVPVGFKRRGGQLKLRPAPDDELHEGDSMVLVANDDNCLKPDATKLKHLAASVHGMRAPRTSFPSSLGPNPQLQPWEQSSGLASVAKAALLLLCWPVSAGVGLLQACGGAAAAVVTWPGRVLAARRAAEAENEDGDEEEEEGHEEDEEEEGGEGGGKPAVALRHWWDQVLENGDEAGSVLGWVTAADGVEGGSGRSFRSMGSSSRLDARVGSSRSAAGQGPVDGLAWWDRVLEVNQPGVGPGGRSGASTPGRPDGDGEAGAGRSGGGAADCRDDVPWWDRALREDSEGGSSGVATAGSRGGGALYRSLRVQSTVALAAARLMTPRSLQRAGSSVASLHSSGEGDFGGRFLICGWRRDMAGLIRAFNEIVTAKSELWLFSSVPLDMRTWLLELYGLSVDADGFSEDLANLRLVFQHPVLLGSLVNRFHMEMLEPLQFRAVILLADDPTSHTATSAGTTPAASQQHSMSEVDSRTLATLLLLRQTQMDELYEQNQLAAEEAQQRRERGEEEPQDTGKASSPWAQAAARASLRLGSLRAGAGGGGGVAAAAAAAIGAADARLGMSRSWREVAQQQGLMAAETGAGGDSPFSREATAFTSPLYGDGAEDANGEAGARAAAAAGGGDGGVQEVRVHTPMKLMATAAAAAAAAAAGSGSPASGGRDADGDSLGLQRTARRTFSEEWRARVLQEDGGATTESTSSGQARPQAVVATVEPVDNTATGPAPVEGLQQQQKQLQQPLFPDTAAPPTLPPAPPPTLQGLTRETKSFRLAASTFLALRRSGTMTAASAPLASVGPLPTPCGGPASLKEDTVSGQLQLEREDSDPGAQSRRTSGSLRSQGSQGSRRFRAAVSQATRMLSGSRRPTLDLFSESVDKSSASVEEEDEEAVSAAATPKGRSTRRITSMKATSAAHGNGGSAHDAADGAPRSARLSEPGGKGAATGGGLDAKTTPRGRTKGLERRSPGPGGKQQPEVASELQQVVQKTTVVTEVLDNKTLALVKDMRVSKYVSSNEMAAQLLALISCAPDRVDVYRELLWPGGNTFNIRQAHTVLRKNDKISFYEASELIMAFGEVLLGYMERETGTTVINPDNKSLRNISRAYVDVFVTIAWGSDSGVQDD